MSESKFLEKILDTGRAIIPKKLFRAAQPIYHYLLACGGALWYRFPSRRLTVIAVTGTKGKSSTTEMVNSILEKAGHKTALLNTIRFKIGENSRPNNRKMTIPGRFFVQKFLRQAVSAHCDNAVIEISSEAVKQFRHKWIDLDALIFTNISPEHIEAHGSFENYLKAKLKLARAIERSKKPNRIIVANADDPNGYKFLEARVENKVSFRMKDAEPWEANENGVTFTFSGIKIVSPLRGQFVISNALAGAQYAKARGIATDIIKRGIESIGEIKGRVQFIKALGGQNFDVVVDYAHTIDSLTKLYQTFLNQRKICVLGNTGGGRDKWKRKGMAEVADKFCDEIILTNEDPYDEDPLAIVEQMKKAIVRKNCLVIMDRREAIRAALGKAKTGDAVLISGKGSDPYIMEAHGKKTPWSDAEVAKEELEKILGNKK
jgi:UDP-N-acetylmuramoyl-L-alanyl-D-glutamate--2,6-diaminopimelate ligase